MLKAVRLFKQLIHGEQPAVGVAEQRLTLAVDVVTLLDERLEFFQ